MKNNRDRVKKMNEIFNYFQKHNITPNEKIVFQSSSPLSYKHIIEFELEKNTVITNSLHESFFENELYCNDSTIKNTKELQEYIQMDLDNNNYKFILIIIVSFSNDLNTFQFYNVNGLQSFLSEFSKIKIEKIKELKTKINLKTYTNGSKYSNSHHESLLFDFTYSSTPMSDTTLSFIENFSKTKAFIGLIPGYLDQQSMREMPLMNLIKSILGLFSNDQTPKKFYFKSKYNLTINCEKEYDYDQMNNHFKELHNILMYIYQNSSTVDQKKTFLRKVVCDPLTQDETKEISNFPRDYFKEVYRDTQFLFETYENDEVSVFLKEKKDILKEYVGISKDIISNINSIKLVLSKNLITIFSVVFINFAFKFFTDSGVNTNEINHFLRYLVITYMALVLFLFLINDLPIFFVLKSRVQAFENQFTFLSSKADTIKEDLKKLSYKEICIYALLLLFTFIVYILILLFLIFILPSYLFPTS